VKKLSSTLSEAYVCEKGSLTVKKNPSRRNALIANLSVDYSVCLDATPCTSTTVTKRGKESAVALAFVTLTVELQAE